MGRNEYLNYLFHLYLLFYVGSKVIPDKNLCPNMSKRALFLSTEKLSDRKELR